MNGAVWNEPPSTKAKTAKAAAEATSGKAALKTLPAMRDPAWP